LERIEQMEAILEDQRIELQITERRRERERRSLLTALRELNSQDCTKSDGDLTEGEVVDGSTSATESQPSTLPEAPAASLLQAASSSAGTPANEMQYLQKISKLEEVSRTLRAKLEKVQAREVALNESAVTRGAALRYATSAYAEQGADAAADVSLGSGCGEESPSSTGRADMDGLMEMLDRLFVENFALRGSSGQQGRLAAQSGGRGGSSSTPAVVASSVSLAPRADSLDLSRFILNEECASDDDDKPNTARSGSSKAPPLALMAASRAHSKPKAAPSPAIDAMHVPGPSAARFEGPGPKNLDDLVSPRSRLLSGLDFHAMPVAE